MAKTKRPFKQVKPKPGRKVRAKRQQYTLELKEKVRAWKQVDRMKTTDIKKRLKAELNLEVPMSILSTWWNADNLARVENVAPDRMNIKI